VAAPLIFSGDIARLDDFTLGLLCNDEVIAVDQDPLGKPGRRISLDDTVEVWARDLEDGAKAVGLFNRGEMAATVTVKWADLGIEGNQTVRDLWRQKDLGQSKDEYKTTVPRHGVVLLRISQSSG
jgi:alpha-galactosidase